ncbi:MAG: RraA family protein, partial [Chthoniobacterales bacterium]
IGDLTALEARASGLAGMIVWGTHRDTGELREIGFSIFSYGTCLSGPRRLEARTDDALRVARFGDFDVEKSDVVFADDDGCVFVRADDVGEILRVASEIREVERRQAERIKSGETLRSQLQFAEFRKKRASDPSYTLRQHLRRRGGAIEE